MTFATARPKARRRSISPPASTRIIHRPASSMAPTLKGSSRPPWSCPRDISPLIARRFEPHGTAWARQIPRLRSGFFELGPRHVPRGRDAASARVVRKGEVRSGAAVPFQLRWVAMRDFSRRLGRISARPRKLARDSRNGHLAHGTLTAGHANVVSSGMLGVEQVELWRTSCRTQPK